MYQTLIFFHSIVRWLVLAGLLTSVYKAFQGYRLSAVFNRGDNLVRHLTATIAHIQLIIGVTLYFQSPAVKQFFVVSDHPAGITESLFFGAIHISMMVSAILILTIGSAMSKRQETDREKFKVMLIWFGLALVIILAAIPWPFSPLAQRPYISHL